MTTLQGTIRNGQILLDAPTTLPEGTRVEVLPIGVGWSGVGMREEDWPTTPEGIEALLARWDQIGPSWLSPEDDAAWRANLKEDKEREKANFMNDAEKLKRIWE